MLEFFSLLLFYVSLPWPWLDLSSTLPFSIRPLIVASIPLFLVWLFRLPPTFDSKSLSFLIAISVTFCVWGAPILYFEFPHWDVDRVFGALAYCLIGYVGAQVYLCFNGRSSVRILGSLLSWALLISAYLSYYKAFGTLTPNTHVSSSTDFIFNNLYGHNAEDWRNGGKGIRHTMAVVPVVLQAIVLHGKKRLNGNDFIVLILSEYLVFFSFSRSAWLASALVLFPYIFRRLIRSGNRMITWYSLFAMGFVIPALLFWSFPHHFVWATRIILDRLDDSSSFSGRSWAVMHLFESMTFSDFLTGFDSPIQYSPHNLLLDSLMQSGILGLLVSTILFVYLALIYLRGCFSISEQAIAAAAFVAPAVVRMLTAGSGMLHGAELFSVFIGISIVMASIRGAGSIVNSRIRERLQLKSDANSFRQNE